MNSGLLLNIQQTIEQLGSDAGIHIGATAGASTDLVIQGPGKLKHVLEIKSLRRPTPSEIQRQSSERSLLILIEPSLAAKEAARRTNHITLPGQSVRLVLPGLVLIAPEQPAHTSVRAVRLRGASGVVVETLLLNRQRSWTIRELSSEAHVSLGLAQRVIQRLISEGFVTGGNQGRRLKDADGLLRLWAQEAGTPSRPQLRAYTYMRNPIDTLRHLAGSVPGLCIGGALAGNSYSARLTNVPTPYKVWIPEATANAELLERAGMGIVEEGANLEIYTQNGDWWQIHATNLDGLLRISPVRSYVELYHTSGRLQELAEALLKEIQ